MSERAPAAAARPPLLLGLATLAVVAWAVGHVVATYTALSHTVDEPTHIAAGMEWLESGTHRLHSENPPLSRVPVGLGLHLAGHELPPTGLSFRRGTDVLYAGGTYERNLTLARVGALPFFLAALALVWLWARRIGGGRAACLAVMAFATLPPVMGHAGLATTDVAFTATFALLLYTAARWLEAPTARRAAMFGLGLGLALATKFSTLVHLPLCLAALALLRWWSARAARRGQGAAAAAAPTGAGGGVPTSAWRWAAGLAGAGLLAALVLWAAYRFQVGRLDAIPEADFAIRWAFPDAESHGRRALQWLSHWPLPAPDAVIGLLWLYAHAAGGNAAYLLGEHSARGFAAFYPVALAVKTPLVFLGLLLAALCGLWRARGMQLAPPATREVPWMRWAPPVAAAAIVASLLPSSINLGVRHVLVVYPLLAVAAGVGVDAGLRRLASAPALWRRAAAAAVALLLGWQVALVRTEFPGYLAYFNALAGREPGRVLVDSDLDWGQDLLQLAEVCRRLGVEQLHIAYFGSAHLCEHGLPPLRWLQPGEPVAGWVAVSEMYYRGMWHNTYDDACDRRQARRSEVRDGYGWLRAYQPVAFAGRSIRLYHVPPE